MSDKANSLVSYAKADDPEITKASARAVATFKYLWRELTWEYRRIIPALDMSAIKAAFNDPGASPDSTEHMWVSDIEFDGDVIQARLLNSPSNLTSISQGDSISLRVDQIEDWMYAIHGRAYGGFTVQVLRGRMSSSELRAHDKAWGLEFAKPDRVNLVPDWQDTPKKNFIGRLFSSETLPVDPDVEHPMSENMASDIAEAVAKNREAFFEVGPAGLNTLHSFALGGSAAGVKALLDAGADPLTKTKSGKTAKDLAKMMGWPRVVAILDGNLGS